MRGKSRWLSAVVAALVVAAVPAAALGQGGRHATGTRLAGSSDRPRQGEWRGGGRRAPIIFDVLRTRKGLEIQTVDVEASADCGDLGGVFFGIGGFSKVLKADGSFRMHLYDPFFGSFDFRGTLQRDTGSGTVSFAIPLLDPDGKAKACSSGDLAWTASAPGATVARAGVARGAQLHVHVTRAPSGQVTWTSAKG